MKTYTCRECKDEFDAPEPVEVAGRILFTPTLCESCDLRRVTLNAAAVTQSRELDGLAEWNRICPPLYRDTDPARLPVKSTSAVLNWQFGQQGLVLAGPTGAGKTRAAYLLLKRVMVKDKRSVAAFHANEFAHQCARTFGDQQGEAWVARLARVDVLFVDDLGKFKMTERVEAELFGLVEARVSHLRPVIATVNATGAELASRLSEDRGAPLVRRLREFCKTVAFT